MNTIFLSGRLCADPELRTTSSGISVATSRLAVDRGYGDKKETDFIPIVMWRNIAENASKYCSKGDKVNLTGTLKTREYEAKKERGCGGEKSVPEDDELPF